MNNLHRELAPVSASAWDSIDEEARRTFILNLAGRRVADVPEPGGLTLAAVGTGHLAGAGVLAEGVSARVRQVQPVVELRVPFTLDRQSVDDVERGAQDPDWQPVKDAARAMALAEDRAIFEGFAAAGIGGIRAGAAAQALALPADATAYPDAVSRAVSTLRVAGVGGPYALVLSPAAYLAVSETADHGYPVRDHLSQVVDGEIIWAPAIDGGFVISTRGGDYELYLGQDLSIGYQAHDAERIDLYFTESLTFLVHTPEAAVPLTGGQEAMRS